MARTATKPTITKGVASAYASRSENIYDVGDGESGALISVSRTPDGRLLIEVYRADADVLVRCDPLNLDFNVVRRYPGPIAQSND